MRRKLRISVSKRTSESWHLEGVYCEQCGHSVEAVEVEAAERLLGGKCSSENLDLLPGLHPVLLPNGKTAICRDALERYRKRVDRS